MRFRSLKVSNLRAVRLFEVSDLKDFIMIAGPNGCGKSCVFDAIRLLKSSYGGYATDEHLQWFTEFAINPQDKSAFRQIFRDPKQPVTIEATIEFASSERDFITNRAADLLWPIAWQRVTGQRMDYWTFSRMAVATQLDYFRPSVEAQIAALEDDLRTGIAAPIHRLAIEIHPDGSIPITPCLPAQAAFQAFEPLDLGIIEYHSASRAYPRQPLQGINLDARAFNEQRRTQTLYNWQAKYQNIKSELAGGYLRTLIAEKAEAERDGEDLNETLKELFRTFFPDKDYLGVRPQPGGGLEFPVRLPSGATHDIDELSSGEKEILYGYLRLRNSTPRNSVILLDEPELHLNPSLLQGFTDFYYRHLGVAQGNQLWLVTHSDTLLRQAIGNSNYRVYHMLTAASSEGNQASEINLDDELEQAVVELVGDLAAYRPHAKVVVVEGSGAGALDESLIRRLFPDFAKRVNIVSGGPKRRVRDLYAVMNAAAATAGIHNRFFAIVDKDSETRDTASSGAQEFTWPVYHIENFLLVPWAIRWAVRSLTGNDPFESDEAVTAAMRVAAEELIDSLVLERIRADINSSLTSALSVKGDPTGGDIAADILPSLRASLERVNQLGAGYTHAALSGMVASRRKAFEAALVDERWIAEFPGRRILQRFVGVHGGGVSYEPFRNLVVDKLAQEQCQPSGMAEILHRILDA